ncbi:hypothetical protein BS78_09G186900 [Paspalum vaginatum]|nr:hypothetical protein BS78_09G186900 [Paspalum vaginatum]
MTGRFVIQKVASGMSRSRASRLAYGASAVTVRADGGAPVISRGTAPEGGIRTLSHLFHPGPAAPNELGIRGQGIVRPPNNNFCRAHPSKASSSSSSGMMIHGFAAARDSSCPRVAAKTSNYTAGGMLPSTITSRMMKYAGSAKRSFSSNVSTEARAWQARWDAFDARMAAKDAEYQKFWRTVMGLSVFTCFSTLLGYFVEVQMDRRRDINDQTISRSCSGRPTILEYSLSFIL